MKRGKLNHGERFSPRSAHGRIRRGERVAEGDRAGRNDTLTGIGKALFISPLTDRSGMALVLVLMIVALITAMVVEFAYGVYVNTNALHNWQTSQKLSLTAKSATTLASRLISANMLEQYKTKSVFDISQKIPFEDIDGIITLRIEDENAKFNLNSLKHPDGYDFFVRLLRILDLNPDIANIVSYWINSSTENRPQNAGNIQPKNAYLDSIDELLLIPGIDRQSYDKLLPYVTIFGSGEGLFLININTADVPVLMSLSDAITRDMAENVITYRQLIPFTDKSQIQNVAGFESGSVSNPLMGHIVKDSSAFHIIATAESGGIRRIVESVLQGGRVRYWKEM